MVVHVQQTDTNSTFDLEVGDGLVLLPGVEIHQGDDRAGATIQGHGDNLIFIAEHASVTYMTAGGGPVGDAIRLFGDALVVNRGTIYNEFGGIDASHAAEGANIIVINTGEITHEWTGSRSGSSIDGATGVVNTGLIQNDIFLDDNDGFYIGLYSETALTGYTDALVAGEGGDDLLVGGVSRDNFSGGEGDDVLAGTLGRDILDGGPGDDLLIGGKRADEFQFDAGDDQDDSYDFVTNFQNNVDTISIDDDLIASGVTVSHPSNNTLLTFGTGDQIEIDDVPHWLLLIDDIFIV